MLYLKYLLTVTKRLNHFNNTIQNVHSIVLSYLAYYKKIENKPRLTRVREFCKGLSHNQQKTLITFSTKCYT